MLEAKARDQGHKRKCSPRKKKGLHKNFSSDLQKKKGLYKNNVFQKIFQALHKILTIQKIVLARPIFEDLRLGGQGQGLDLRGQDQELQNLSSRTPPLIGSFLIGGGGSGPGPPGHAYGLMITVLICSHIK